MKKSEILIRNQLTSSLKKFLIHLILENKNFIEILYKDVYYLIKDINKKDENDLLIKNGSLGIENGSIELSGYQSRLHNLSIWLHMEICIKFMEKNPLNFIENMQNFENNFLKKTKLYTRT